MKVLIKIYFSEVRNLNMNGKYKSVNKLSNILKLRNKTELRKEILSLLLFCMTTVIINYRT